MPPSRPLSPRLAITLIVLAQLFGTSLWFSANSAADDLIQAWGLSLADLGSGQPNLSRNLHVSEVDILES